MAEDRTVLEHLLDGRNALLREVSRLNAAIEQLDTVLGRIGTGGSPGTNGSALRADAVELAAATDTSPREPVNPPAEVEPAASRAVPSRTRSTPRKTAARESRSRARGQGARASTARSSGIGSSDAGAQGEAPKSIRVHVLEMLAADNRDFGLAEIIDRVHGAGIQAHDDAVRSITIKLIKDGRVERVGRGQYRLARRGAAARAASAATATAPRVTEVAPEPAISVPQTSLTYADPVASDSPETATPTFDPLAQDAGQLDAFAPQVRETDEPQPAGPDDTADDLSTSPAGQIAAAGAEVETHSDAEPMDSVGEQAPPPADVAIDEATSETAGEQHHSHSDDAPQEPASAGYVPPLNLGQPWNG